MTGHADRSASAPESHELAGLRGRRLGTCTTCGEAVFAAESFTRFRGRVAHVRCAVAARSGRIAARVPAPGVRFERRLWR